MSPALHFLFWTTIVTTTAYKCTDGGCFIDHTEDNRNFDQPRTEHIALVSARLIERTPSYSVVSRSPFRHKANAKLEDASRKENGSYKILNENPRIYPKISSRTGGVSEDKVVFPGPTSDMSYIPVIPDECKRIGICEEVLNYPEEKVASLVASKGVSRKYQIDQLDIPETPDIAQRLGPQEENMELCVFREKIVYPRAAPDNDGNWFMVVNPKGNPIQGFRVEICETDQSACADFVSFQPGYQARCVQKHFRRSMQVLDASGGMVEKPLLVPSCCSCVARLV